MYEMELIFVSYYQKKAKDAKLDNNLMKDLKNK